MTPEQMLLTGALAALADQSKSLLAILLASDEGWLQAALRIEQANLNLKVQCVLDANRLVATLRALAELERLAAQGLEVHPQTILVNPARRHPVFYGPEPRSPQAVSAPPALEAR